jgi:uncharacterized membrane protein HdeD (DUF308 family)
MFSLIPWDVRLAGFLMLLTGLAAFFDPGPALFVALYVMLCAYIVVSTFTEE